MNKNNVKYIPVLVLCIAAVLSSLVFAQDIPKPMGFVSDFAGVLTSTEILELESLSDQLLQVNGTELAVVTVKRASKSDSDFDKTAIQYLNKHKIGQKHANNGVLILLATEQRKLGIYPGKGLEAALPDSLCKEIIDTEAVPKLKRGSEKWGQAVIAMVNEMSPYIKGEKFPDKGTGSSACCIPGCFILVWLAVSGFIVFLGWATRVRCPVCKGKVKLLKSTIVLTPTTEHSGLEKREYECTVCKHKFMRSVTLPAKGKKSASGGFWGGWSSSSSGGWSSSSGGSFGGFSGGCSGGGGASSSF